MTDEYMREAIVRAAARRTIAAALEPLPRADRLAVLLDLCLEFAPEVIAYLEQGRAQAVQRVACQPIPAVTPELDSAHPEESERAP